MAKEELTKESKTNAGKAIGILAAVYDFPLTVLKVKGSTFPSIPKLLFSWFLRNSTSVMGRKLTLLCSRLWSLS